MSIETILASEVTQSLIISVLGIAWGVIQGTKWFQRIKDRRYYKCLKVIEEAVRDTFYDYVKQVKDANADGKLTDDEKSRAKRYAMRRLETLAAEKGIPVFQQFTVESVNRLFDTMVQRLQQGILVEDMPGVKGDVK